MGEHKSHSPRVYAITIDYLKGSFTYYVRMKGGEGGRVKAYAMRTRGEGELTNLSAYAKKSLLSHYVAYGDNFHCCAKKHLS